MHEEGFGKMIQCRLLYTEVDSFVEIAKAETKSAAPQLAVR